MTDIMDAVRALRERGVNSPEALLEHGTPEQILAACHRWDKQQGVSAGLLVKWIRDGNYTEPDEKPAQSKGAILRARFDEYVRHHPQGSIAEPHATLIARRWPNELDFDTCNGNMIITAADYPIIEMDCDKCGFAVGASARQLHLIGSGA